MSETNINNLHTLIIRQRCIPHATYSNIKVTFYEFYRGINEFRNKKNMHEINTSIKLRDGKIAYGVMLIKVIKTTCLLHTALFVAPKYDQALVI